MSQIRTPTDPNQRATTSKKSRQNRNQCCLLNKQKEQAEGTQNGAGNKNRGAKNSIPNKNNNKSYDNNNNNENSNSAERKPKNVYPLRYVAKQTFPQRDATMELTQPVDRLLGTKDRKDEIRSHKEAMKVIQMKLDKLQPKI